MVVVPQGSHAAKARVGVWIGPVAGAGPKSLVSRRINGYTAQLAGQMPVPRPHPHVFKD
jgi:hypothetical protein